VPRGYKTDAEKYRRGGSGYDSNKQDIVAKTSFSWKNTGFKQTDSHPVVNVSWNDAVAFCHWLTNVDGKHTYRLPPEAEREYAGRAGSTTEYCWGKTARSMISRENVADHTHSQILSGKSEKKKLCASWSDRFPFTAPVGSFTPNKWGLYDTHGNVQEWCQDLFDDNRYLKPNDFKPLFGDRRVARGGTCLYRPKACRVARRFAPPRSTNIRCHLGFRIVRDINTTDKRVAVEGGPPHTRDITTSKLGGNRSLVTWVLSMNGAVRVQYGGGRETSLSDISSLQDRPFVLKIISIPATAAVTDDDLQRLSELRSLERLYIRPSNISNKGIEHLKGLTNLRRLSLDGSQISNLGLQYIAGLKRLEQLDLSETQITDTGLLQLQTLPNLKLLFLNNTSITDEGAELFQYFYGLRELRIEGTQISQGRVLELRKSLPDCKIDW